MASPDDAISAQLQPDVPHAARIWNYWMGGKDNFAADRASGDEFERHFPKIRIGVRANRDFLHRATRFVTAEAGVRQFLDIGTGLPTADNTHQVAQGIAPDTRIVYVDNDPLVLTHARALLTSSDEGETAYLEADLRDPEAILRDPVLRETLDLSRPVALMLVAVLHFIPGRGSVQPIVDRLLAALPSGSFLVATHGTEDFLPPELARAHQRMVQGGRSDVWMRDREEFAALFAGLDLVEPGVVPASEWRPEPGAPVPDREDVALWGAVGRKP
jgi:S-adenosyl methyltransferase